MPLDQMMHDPDPREMSFFEHLDELRRALVISLISILVGSAAGFIWYKPILDLLISQVHGVKFVILSPAEGFTAVLRLAIMMGLFFGLPVILRELFWFIGPALTRTQRLVMIPVTVVSYALFVLGVVFAYWLLLPVGLSFLIGFRPPGIEPMISIDNYIGFSATLIFSTGLLFQLPILMLLLSVFGILRRSRLSTQRRYVLFVSFVVAAVITPSVDIMTQSLLAGTLMLLFEVGLILMWFAERIRGVPERDRFDFDPEPTEAVAPAAAAAQDVAMLAEIDAEVLILPSSTPKADSAPAVTLDSPIIEDASVTEDTGEANSEK